MEVSHLNSTTDSAGQGLIILVQPLRCEACSGLVSAAQILDLKELQGIVAAQRIIWAHIEPQDNLARKSLSRACLQQHMSHAYIIVIITVITVVTT